LNAIRLVLAVGVIFGHSYPVTGTPRGSQLLHFLIGGLCVDSFFAISGFLIARSWLRNPDTKSFILSRLARIFPAFIVCLVATAFLLAPITGLLTQKNILDEDNFLYVVGNLGLWINHPAISDTLQNVPYAGIWNASLWTLSWEFYCYLFVLALGRLGLLRQRLVPVFICIILAWLVFAGWAFQITNALYLKPARLLLLFFCGLLIQIFARQLKTNLPLALSSLVATIMCIAILPEYKIPGAFLLAYGVLGLGLSLRPRWLQLKNDFSYGIYIYGFPLQQFLAALGLTSLPVLAFSILAVICAAPFAVASWFFIEKPAIRWARR
jgi:peptidoglycan/LPS O-acetylase OafA/YrhL